MTEKKIVEAVSFHRNGSGQEAGFTVSIVNDPLGRMLIIDFGTDSFDDEEKNAESKKYFAVLDLDEAAKGNIYRHPHSYSRASTDLETGGNSWRGDHFTHYREAIEAQLTKDRDAVDAGDAKDALAPKKRNGIV